MSVRSMIILGILALILVVLALLREPAPSGSDSTTLSPPSGGRAVGKSALSHGGPPPESPPVRTSPADAPSPP